MEFLKNFGNRIKSLRESIFLSQEDLAEKLGVHRNTLARIENGNNFVSAETLEKLAKALGVEPTELFIFNKKVKNNARKALKIKLEELNEDELKYFIANINSFIKLKSKKK